MTSKKHVFTQIEKKVFLDLLKAYTSVIENKNTDGSTLREKNITWDNITRKYNASPHVTAEISNKQLRRLWMNMKQRQREAVTKERQHRMATGGGPSTSSTVIDPDVAQIAPGLMVEIPGAIDSDSVFLENADVLLDMDSNQPILNLNLIHQPSTSTGLHLSQPDISPIPSPTTTTSPPALIVTIPPPRSTTTPPPPRSTTTPPPLRTTTTPPRFSLGAASLPTPSTSSTFTTSFQRHKNIILEKEYRDRSNRAGELHAMEKELLQYKIREAKAKAELAEFLFRIIIL